MTTQEGYGGYGDRGDEQREDDGGGFHMPTGVYRGRAVEWALADTSAGKEQIAVLCEFLDEGHAGKRMTWYGSFSDTVLRDGRTVAEMTLDALRTMGWQGDDLSNIASLPDEVSLVVGQETYNGVSRSKINFINGKTGLAIKAPMAVDKAKAFAARMKGLAVKSRQQGGAAAAPWKPPSRGPQGQRPPQDQRPHPNAPDAEDYGPPPGDDERGF